MTDQKQYIAHFRAACPEHKQLLSVHLEETSSLARTAAARIGLEKLGALIGLMHDFGKYSKVFQVYLASASGLIDQDADEYIDAKTSRGKIDHSTAGAQYIWQHLYGKYPILAKVAALCIASHHSGLIDILAPDGCNNFHKRMSKDDSKSNLEETKKNADQKILNQAEKLLNDSDLIREYGVVLRNIKTNNPGYPVAQQCQTGLMVRMLFSCLIDADRTNSIDFESLQAAKARPAGRYCDWNTLLERLQARLDAFNASTDVQLLRASVAQHCLDAAEQLTGLFTLTVPTGGGKTLASLRFALRHALEHEMERIIFVVPYTTIIEQNAGEVRDILEKSAQESPHSIVLEHHSNLLPPEDEEEQKHRWRHQLLTENWDAPVIFTTSVQLLECLFSGGTRSVRRMHQLARSVIVFDEIQSLDIKMTHLFCNAMNLLVEQCESTVVLCTATQPLLHDLKRPENGALKLSEKSEIIPDVPHLFNQLRRVSVQPDIRSEGWDIDDIARLAIDHCQQYGSCLVVVNTKKSASQIYKQCVTSQIQTVHLSTSMCPAHRRQVLTNLHQQLEKSEPVICISTQLIEAGVDISFASAIRFLAGLDSIAQTAGRCNRNNELPLGVLTLVNLKDENLDLLPDIKLGKKVTEQILREFQDDSDFFDNDLLLPKAMHRYYELYLHQRADEMSYRQGAKQLGRDDSLLNLLSKNYKALKEHSKQISADYKRLKEIPDLFQSFATAGRLFKAIDAPTQGIIVDFGKGKDLIAELFACDNFLYQKRILKELQPYTVNVFPHTLKKLHQNKALSSPEGTDILCLEDGFYHTVYGLDTKQNELMTFYEA